MLTEQQKARIIDLIYNILNEGVQDVSEKEMLAKITSGEKVYHRPKDSQSDDPLGVIKSLFRRGFSREYTGSNGGNMYGAGVYNVYNLRSSNEKASGYGRYIVQSYVIDGYKDFLIFNEELAKKYYGENWWIGNQIKLLMPPQIAQQVLNRFGRSLYMNDNNTLYRNTSKIAVNITDFLGKKIYSTKVRGIIYSGGHGGCCAFVRDFTDVYPYAYTTDNGKTWKKEINSELMQHLMGNIDTDFELKGRLDAAGKRRYDDVANKSINGFALVWKNDKANYYSVETRNLISDIWFDDAYNFDKHGYAEIQYNGVKLCIHNDGNGNYSITDTDGAYICDLNELKDLF